MEPTELSRAQIPSICELFAQAQVPGASKDGTFAFAQVRFAASDERIPV